MTSGEFGKRIVDMQETLYRVCYSLLPQACDREDAVQECICIAWQKQASLRNEQQMQTWVIRILINVCYSLLKKAKRESPAESVLNEFSGYTAPHDAVKELHDELTALPAALRLPVTLHYLEGHSLIDIARMLRLPVGTIKSRLNRARKLLKTNMLYEEQRI